jgi:hypothetical protein
MTSGNIEESGERGYHKDTGTDEGGTRHAGKSTSI